MRSSWQTPIGDARLNLALRRQQLREQQAQTLVRIARETGGDDAAVVRPGALPGDELALRGIPAIGRGVQGVIRFTRPGDGIRE